MFFCGKKNVNPSVCAPLVWIPPTPCIPSCRRYRSERPPISYHSERGSATRRSGRGWLRAHTLCVQARVTRRPADTRCQPPTQPAQRAHVLQFAASQCIQHVACPHSWLEGVGGLKTNEAYRSKADALLIPKMCVFF